MTILFLLLCFFTTAGWGQDQPGERTPPGVTIGKYKWQKVGEGPATDPSLKAENDSASGDGAGASDSSVVIRQGQFFLYSVEVKNESARSIRAVLWDYIVTDSNTREELGLHEFVSFEKVARNGSKALTAKSRLSPSRIVTVQDSPPVVNSTVVEHVILRCVLFDDESMWEQPSTLPGTCDALRQRAKSQNRH